MVHHIITYINEVITNLVSLNNIDVMTYKLELDILDSKMEDINSAFFMPIVETLKRKKKKAKVSKTIDYAYVNDYINLSPEEAIVELRKIDFKLQSIKHQLI